MLKCYPECTKEVLITTSQNSLSWFKTKIFSSIFRRIFESASLYGGAKLATSHLPQHDRRDQRQKQPGRSGHSVRTPGQLGRGAGRDGRRRRCFRVLGQRGRNQESGAETKKNSAGYSLDCGRRGSHWGGCKCALDFLPHNILEFFFEIFGLDYRQIFFRACAEIFFSRELLA